MKLNDWILLIATAAYSYLFFEQSAGINFFLFSVLLVFFCLLRNIKLVQRLPWLVVAAGTLISGFAVFYYGTWLAIYANVVSIIVLGAFSFDTQTSFFVAFLNSVFSLAHSIPGLIKHIFVRTENTGAGNNENRVKKILLLSIPTFLALIFFILYRESNPLFEKVTAKINFDFINLNFLDFEWIIFTGFGLLFIFSFFFHKAIQFLTAADKNNSDNLAYITEEEHEKGIIPSLLSTGNELFTGVALLVMLNLLLLSVNGIDIFYLYIMRTLPQGLTEAQRLHDGTNALIFSIALAIGILLFFFRGRLNFLENNRSICLLAQVWIAQNVFMVITTLQRNYAYISHYGITQKRIGVYIFLALCIAGLVMTFIKIVQVKSNWFMFRKTTWLWYSVLVLSSVINWDAIIVAKNLRMGFEKTAVIDYHYLGGLSHTALPVFYRFYAGQPQALQETKMQHSGLLLELKAQYLALSQQVDSAGWQSACLIKIQGKKEIDALQEKVKL